MTSWWEDVVSGLLADGKATLCNVFGFGESARNSERENFSISR
jgi:hypothetical protein